MFQILAQVKAFVELAGSLLSAGAPKPAGSPQRTQTQGLSGEMLRSMRFAGVISALIGAMELLDADHPQVHLFFMPACDEEACLFLTQSNLVLVCLPGALALGPSLYLPPGISAQELSQHALIYNEAEASLIGQAAKGLQWCLPAIPSLSG